MQAVWKNSQDSCRIVFTKQKGNQGKNYEDYAVLEMDQWSVQSGIDELVAELGTPNNIFVSDIDVPFGASMDYEGTIDGTPVTLSFNVDAGCGQIQSVRITMR